MWYVKLIIFIFKQVILLECVVFWFTNEARKSVNYLKAKSVWTVIEEPLVIGRGSVSDRLMTHRQWIRDRLATASGGCVYSRRRVHDRLKSGRQPLVEYSTNTNCSEVICNHCRSFLYDPPVSNNPCNFFSLHDDVIKWKHFPRYWPFVRGIHRSPVNSPHKGQWRGALMFSLIYVWINGWANIKAGDVRRYRAHYDVTVMHYCARMLEGPNQVMISPN